MNLEFVIILVGLLGLLLDFFTSTLLMPRIRIHGQRSVLSEDEKARHPEWDAARRRVYQFAVQSDESRELEFEGHGMVIELQIRGAGQFVAPHVRGFIGPQELRAVWLEHGKTVALQVPIMRPHKTWVFRCYTTETAEEMRMCVRVPPRWPVRRFLMEVSRSLFTYEPDLDEKRITVRQREDRELTRGFRHEGPWLWIRLASFAVLGALIYGYACGIWGPGALGIRVVAGPQGPARMQAGEPAVIGLGILLVVLLLHRMARRPSLPIAQGYQIPRDLVIEPPPAVLVRHSRG